MPHLRPSKPTLTGSGGGPQNRTLGSERFLKSMVAATASPRVISAPLAVAGRS